MPRLTPERREEEFAAMRERQKQLREARAGAPRESRTAYHRRERRKAQGGLPAHLDFYRVNEVAEILGVSRKTVVRWFKGRAVRASQSGKGSHHPKQTLLISRQLLEDWVREHTPRVA